MKKIYHLLGLLLIILAFSGCDPSESNSNPNDNFAENFGNAVNRSFIGQVVDADNHPIQNVAIKIGTSTAQTDVNGVFIIKDAPVHEKFAYITATKSGYFDGSRSLVPTTGMNNVKIILVENAPTDTVQSGTASEVSIYSGTKVNFDGAFQDENGNAYSGDVQVALFHLAPTDENLESLMPGMLYAQTETNQEAVLETFGMLNVELRGTTGQKLNIAEGHTAQITMRIDDAQLATAPATIPLWHFDEEGGYWKEDGVATKSGNYYVGTVSHFSWWNCDAPFQTVRLTATVVDSNGNGLANVSVGLSVSGSAYTTYGMTNSSGQVSGLVPANAVMTVTVLDICGGNIYTGTIGPFSVDTVLPNIVITSAMAQPTVVQGTLLKCDNTTVTNGYVIMDYGPTHSVMFVTGGTFSFSTLVCASDNNFTLEGIDFDNLQSTGEINYTFTSPVTNIGLVTSCNALTEFITYQIDSNPPVILVDNLSASTTPQGGTGQQFYLNSILNSFYLNGNTHVPGIYTTNEFSLYANDIGEMVSNTLQFNLSSFGAVGEYVDLTVSGTYVNFGGGPTHTLTFTAHVIRDY